MKQWAVAGILCLLLLVAIPMALDMQRRTPAAAPSDEVPAARGTVAVLVDTDPSRASVSVDGEPRGRTPLVLHGRDQEVVELNLSAEGHHPLRRYLILKSGMTRQVLRLAPLAAAAPPASAPPPPPLARPPAAVTMVAAPPTQVVVTYDQKTLDERARHLPESEAQTVNGLAAALTAGLSRPEDKARVIYVWVATHIRYDVDAFFNQTLLDTRAEHVLAVRSAVCGGYATLFDALALASGLESKVVTGNSKGLEDINPASKARTNHAWNAVRLGGEWKLIDVTWGGGALDRERHFMQRLEDFYFLTPPNEFIFTHFPDDPQWQCLPRPIGWSEYQSKPWTDPQFWKCGMALDTPQTAHIDTDSETDIRVATPEGVVVMGRVEDGPAVHRDWVFSQRDGADYDVRAIFPRAGHFKVRLFARRESESKNLYDGALIFDVTVRSGDPARTFPSIYRDFVTNKAYLFEPLDGHLAARSQHFKVRVPSAQSVTVLCGSQWFPLSQEGDIWSGNVTVLPGEVYVVPIFAGETSHHSILKYFTP